MGFYSSHIDQLKPQTMVAHYAYITRKGKYGKRGDFVYSESGHMPNWAKYEADYWQTVQDKELEIEYKVANGEYGKKQYAVRKLTFALPNEMTHDEMIAFTQEYLAESYKNLPYTFAIHEKDSAIYGEKNPHVHVIFADYVDNERSRNLDRDTYFKMHGVSKAGREYGGAYRTRDFAMYQRVYRMARKDLADRINAYYEERGIDKRVSEKSLAQQKRESLQQGDCIPSLVIDRTRPFRLNPRKFAKYQKIIQEKVLAGWENVKNLDDVPDPEVKNRIVQEFEKQIIENFEEYLKTFEREPSDLDKIHAIEAQIDELQTFMKFTPNRNTSIMARNEKRLEELEKEKNWIQLRMSDSTDENYYLSLKYKVEITHKYQNEEVVYLMNASSEEKVKEYATAAYTIKAMHKRINTLLKEKEDDFILAALNDRTDGEAEALKKKLDSKESILRYLEKNARCALAGQGRQTENLLEPTAFEEAEAPALDWGPALNALRAAAKPACAVQPVQGDLFTYWETLPEGQLDLIVSNPPYLTAAEMQQLQPEVAQEPAMALEAGEDGLVFYRALAQHYQRALRPGGALALEIGWQQREAVTALLAENGWVHIECRKDFGGNDRCILARRPTK